MIYIINCLFSMFLFKIMENYSIKNKFFYMVPIMPLLLLGALRKDVGIDYTTYSVAHIPLTLLGIENKVEYISQKIIIVGYIISGENNYYYIFAIFHIIFIISIYIYILKNSRNYYYSTFILVFSTFYNFSLSGIRQSAATAIAFAFIFLLKNNKFKNILLYIFIIYIASLIHNSSLVFLIFIFLSFIKINKKLGSIIIISSFIILLYAGDYISSFMEILGFYDEYIGSKFFNGNFTRMHQYFIIIISMSINIIYHFLIKKSKIYLDDLNIYIGINYILLAAAILMKVIPTPSRIIYMFIPVYIVLIPNITKRIDNTGIKIFFLVFIILLFIILFLISILINNWYSTLPYKTFL